MALHVISFGAPRARANDSMMRRFGSGDPLCVYAIGIFVALNVFHAPAIGRRAWNSLHCVTTC